MCAEFYERFDDMKGSGDGVKNFAGRMDQDVLVKKDVVCNLILSSSREFRRLLLVMFNKSLDDS